MNIIKKNAFERYMPKDATSLSVRSKLFFKIMSSMNMSLGVDFDDGDIIFSVKNKISSLLV